MEHAKNAPTTHSQQLVGENMSNTAKMLYVQKTKSSCPMPNASLALPTPSLIMTKKDVYLVPVSQIKTTSSLSLKNHLSLSIMVMMEEEQPSSRRTGMTRQTEEDQ